jgi:hypothetical protein
MLLKIGEWSRRFFRQAASYSASCMRFPAAATPLPPTQNNVRAPHCHDAICGLSARYRHDRPGQLTDRAQPIIDYLKMFETCFNTFPGFDVEIQGVETVGRP